MASSEDTGKFGLVVTVHHGKIGVMGAHGGHPTMFITPPGCNFKVGDWCEVDIATMDIKKKIEPVTTTDIDYNGLITIKSYLVRFDDSPAGQVLSPYAGNVSVPGHFNFRKAYVYEANITCYVNSRDYDALIANSGTAWKMSEAAELMQVVDITTLTDVESLANKAGWSNEIELKPKVLDPKDVLLRSEAPNGQKVHEAPFGQRNEKVSPAGPDGGARWLNRMNGFRSTFNSQSNQFNFDPSDFKGGSTASSTTGAAAAPSAPAVVAPIIPPVDREYPYLGVVVSVQKDIIVVYTREAGSVYVDKQILTTKQKFELTSCNWVKLNYAPNTGQNNREFKLVVTKIRGAINSEMSKELRDIEWASARSYADTIKLANATLYFVPNAIETLTINDGMRAQNKRPGEAIVFHPFVGEVLVDQGAHYSIRRHRENFDATVEMSKETTRTVWKVTNFVYDGQELTLNGYMSKIGHGKWQQVRDQNLPRLAMQKEKNLTTKNSAPAPNAAVKGSLGWHIPTMPDPEQERDFHPYGQLAGDVGAENIEYEDVLVIVKSHIAPKVEFARKLEAPAADDSKKKGKMAYGFTQATDEMATYSMPPAVTTMPMKMKNEMMGTEGGWVDRDRHRSRRAASRAEDGEKREGGEKRRDEQWYDDEYQIDEKGTKNQEGWDRVQSLGMVVTAQKGRGWIVWMKVENRVIAVRSKDLYVTAWADVDYLWNDEKKLINLTSINQSMEEPEGIAPEYDEDAHKTMVRCVVDFIVTESQTSLVSAVLGVIEVHEPEVHEKIWYEDYFGKKIEIQAEFRLEEEGMEGLAGQWVMIDFIGVVGEIEAN